MATGCVSYHFAVVPATVRTKVTLIEPVKMDEVPPTVFVTKLSVAPALFVMIVTLEPMTERVTRWPLYPPGIPRRVMLDEAPVSLDTLWSSAA